MRVTILSKLYELQGGYISGTDLAEELGVSRVAVWKHIDALKQEGYDITGVSGKGYTLNNWQNIILPAEVKQKLVNSHFVKEVMFYPTLNSTNELAKELARNNTEKGLVVVAGKQTAGKGRLGRRWESPPGGLWFSIILKPKLALHELSLLSLVFAVAVAKALDNFLPTPTSLKWPNDVFINEKKLAGILLEVSGQIDNIDHVIVGIGINVNILPENIPIDKENVTSLLAETNRELVNSHILAVILSYIEDYYHLFLQTGFAKIRQEFKEKCFHLGKNISINQPKHTITGLNIDIDEQGSLVLEVGQDVVYITTGDVKII